MKEHESVRQGLSSEQKFGFLLLMFLGVFGVVFGFKSFGANIRLPLDMQRAKYAANPLYSSEEKEAKELAALKTKDTDTDSLTDYDELYVYKTSAYLSDSDSDGKDDKTEVFGNTDPTCPEGTDCSVVVTDLSADASLTDQSSLPAQTQTDFGSLLAEIQATANVNASGSAPQPLPDVKQIIASMSAEDIRVTLAKSGISREITDKISDNDLRTMFEKSVEKTMTSVQKQPQPDSSTVSP